MYIINAKAEDVYLVNITPMNLKGMIEWYNNDELKYATGIEGSIELYQLAEMYNKVQQSEVHFWTGIFVSSTDKMIGVLKGQIKFGSIVSVWINTLIIDKPFRNKGYGTKIVNLFMKYTKMKSNISRVYIAVSDCNVKGYKFWESLGFEHYGRIDDCSKFRGEASNAIIMYKSV